MSVTLPTGGEMSMGLARDNLYNMDTECFVDKLSTASQTGCSAAYGTRLLRSNYYGPMVRVRRSVDNVEQDFYGDIFGKLGTRVNANGTSLTSWLGGATGYVSILYDQSGNVRNVSQNTNANQPTISTSGITYSGSQWLQLTNTQVPPSALTGNTTTISGQTYIASASSSPLVGNEAYRAFDFNAATMWHSNYTDNPSAPYNNNTGIYIGSTTTTDIYNVVHGGEWLQLQLPSAIKLNSFYITPRSENNLGLVRSPRDFTILGSNDGTSWNVVHQEFNRTNWTTASQTFTVLSSNPAYNYYRIVVKRVGNLDSGNTGINVAGSDSLQIAEWILNPTTVPLTAGNDRYTFYATWTPTTNNIAIVCEQNSNSFSANTRAALLILGSQLKYGFNGEGNDRHDLVPFVTNIKRRTVMMCDHNFTTGNVEIYDEGVLYKGTTTTPANLNVGSDAFIIGRNIGGSEYFSGQINEIIVTNNTARRNEALLYFTPTLLTKPKELFPKPKKMLTFAPSADIPGPINHGAIAIANLNLDLINVSNGTAVSDWNGYAQATAGNRPVYYDRGGNTNDMGYINFDRANGHFLNGGSKTLNIATNGGLTMIALVKFTGAAVGWERIIDFSNDSSLTNSIIFARQGLTSNIAVSFRNGLSAVAEYGVNAIVQNEWAIFSVRYTHSSRVIELFKNNVLLDTRTIGTGLTDRTLANCFIGRANDGAVYISGQMGGVYVFDRSLSNNEMTTLANGLTIYSLPNIPRHVSEISNIGSGELSNLPVYLPSRSGWSANFNGLVDNFVDVQDIPAPPVSFTFWFKPDIVANTEVFGLNDKNRNDTGGAGIAFQLNDQSKMLFYVNVNGTWNLLSNNIAYTVGTWYHASIIINTNFNIQFYINGTNYVNWTGAALPSKRSRVILGSSSTGWGGFRGSIQDFRVYDYILRGDEILKVIDNISMNQQSLQATTNYLVNTGNWYSIMQLGKAGAPFTGAYVAQMSGVDPDVQYQLLNSTTLVNNYLYHNQRIQDYKSFTCSYEIYTSGLDATYGGGDQMYFFVGATAIPVGSDIYNNCNYVDFQVYSANPNANKGVAFFRNGTNVSQSHYSQYIGASRWVSVSITYNRGKSEGTWVINMNGQDIITYTDTNNESWRASSGSYWGIGGWAAGATMTSYIKRVELTYVPDVSSRLVKGLVANSTKKYPEAALTANSSLNCVASSSSVNSGVQGYLPWKAFNNTTDSESIYASSNNVYNTTTGAYIGGVSTVISGITYSGEWLQIQLPYAISLTDYTIACRPTYETTQSPNTWIIAGSNDGTTWILLDSRTNISNWSTTLRQQNFKVNTSTRYMYFRMVCTVTSQTADMFIVSEWQLNGYGQFGVKYPIAPMTSDITTFSGNALGCGTYKTTYSSTWSSGNYQGWRAFDNESGGDNAFHIGDNGAGGAYSGTNGIYAGAVTTIISGSSYSGEWLQIELPQPIRLSRYSLICRTDTSIQSAKTWKIAGSNDNSTWVEVDSESNITGWANSVAKTFTTANSTVAYKYYRMVTNQITDPSGLYWSQREWMLYDDTTSVKPFYNKVPGLVEGLTWKYYGSDLGSVPSAFLTNSYRNIGRTTNITNINAGTNGQYNVSSLTYYSIEWTGYFRAPVTGTYTFYTASDDWSYLWLGNLALVGSTTTNAIVINGGYHGVTEASGTVFLIEGVYYPIRIQYGDGGGGSDIQVSFTQPNGTRTFDGTGYFFSSIGTNQAYPGESAKIIKDITSTNIDGIYYINVNGVSTPVHCLMNDQYDGGGWMMLMKATRGTTFNYSANLWTSANTLNATETNRLDGDAKFNTFNYSQIKDVMAIWPDISPTTYTNIYGKNGGSLNVSDGWVWKIDNWNGSTRTTALSGFQDSRDAHPSNPFVFNGYSTGVFSNQSTVYRHVIGGGTHISSNINTRWGLLYNNEADFASCDAANGIGMSSINYSAGDYATVYATSTGLNRNARIEMYGR